MIESPCFLAAAPLLGVLVEFALFALNLWLSGGPTTSGTIKWAGTLILGLHPLVGIVHIGFLPSAVEAGVPRYLTVPFTLGGDCRES